MVKETWIGSAILLSAIITTGVNERWLVRHTQSLEEGLASVVSLPEPISSAQNEGKLVLFSGIITTDPSVLSADSKASRTPFVLDPLFGIAARGVRLHRHVEMLQWVETAHTSITNSVGDGNGDDNRGTDEQREKTYLYDLRWRSDRVDSMSFHDMSYQNPSEDAWVYKSKRVDAEAVAVGDFKMSDDLLDQITRKDPVHLDTSTLKTMRTVLNDRVGSHWDKTSALKDVSVEEDYFYLLRDGPGRPGVGDLRVSFGVTPAYPVTVSGKQVMHHVRPFETKAGEPILILEDGILTAQELYKSKLSTKYQHNRFYRLFSSTLGFLGFLVLYPLLSARFGPAFTKIQKHIVCCILSCGLTFSIASLCWFVPRPLWALLLAAGGLSPTLALAAFVSSSLRADRHDKSH